MSIPNAIRDDNEGYILEEDIDVAAWISKISADIPCPAFMNQMKAVFGSHINFETAFSGFKLDSLTPNHQATWWIMDCSTPIRVGSQITKGCKDKSQVAVPVNLPTGSDFLTLILKHCSLSKEQIYTQIIPYMERDGEKQLYSTAGLEHAAYMQICQCAPAPNKGKKPLTGSIQSKYLAHALQLAKAGESSRQRLDVELDAYNQLHEPALPYDEELPHGVSDIEMSTPKAITAEEESELEEMTQMLFNNLKCEELEISCYLHHRQSISLAF
ncbi:hypothetical protein M422DRAFT_246813 [Sphaerobolus stellatus SS14]|nr:hypothetical protein M422DRAFT_246813 [Sphaerobolus stellatus SS14]